MDTTWTRRDFLRRTSVAGGLVLGGGLVAAGCSRVEQGSALQAAREAGSMRIGIANEQPYGFTNAQGQVTGEAPEVARAVLQALGIGEIQAETVEFGSLIPGLNARRFDLVCAGMNITPERCGQAAFSVPDYTAFTAFLVPRGNPQAVATFEDVAAKNLTIAVLGAAVERGYAEGAGVPAGNIQELPDQNGLLQSVIAGRTYCSALTDISLNWLAESNPQAPVEVTEAFTPVVDGEDVVSAGGFVFRQADNDLREAFNTELDTLHGNGRWLEIASPFGFAEVNLPGDLTTQQLCSA